MSTAKIKITIEKDFPFDDQEHDGEKIIEVCKKAFEEFPYDFLTQCGENTVLDVAGEIV